MEPVGHVEFVHRSWPADPEHMSVIRHDLARWLTPLRLSEDDTSDVVLAVDEAVANAVRHAYGPEVAPGTVELTLWTEPHSLCIEVVDHGHWRPPDAKTDEQGWGIPLMTTVSESVLIHYDERGSRVLLRYRMPNGA